MKYYLIDINEIGKSEPSLDDVPDYPSVLYIEDNTSQWETIEFNPK